MPATITDPRPRLGSLTVPRPRPAWRRLAWFVVIWLAGASSLALVAYGLRLALGLG